MIARCGESRLTRRDFLTGAAGAAVALSLSGGRVCAAAAPRSRVVLVRDGNALDSRRRPEREVLASMLDRAVTSLLGEPGRGEVWKRLISPDDTVGIKSNVWSYLPTPPELEDLIVERVRSAGVPTGRISVSDRGVLGDRIFRESTALINIRPMRTHHWAGVGSCIKNYIMFSPNPSSWHDDSCVRLGGLWDLPMVKGKTRLNILVMLTPLFHGKGPHHFNARYTWEYRGLLVGTDPVAVDAIGLRILEAKRREFFGDARPFAVPPHHIRAAAERFGLGVSDPALIDLVRVGWKEGVLI